MQQLADQLPLPVFGLEVAPEGGQQQQQVAGGRFTTSSSSSSIQEVAAGHLKTLLALQPVGPYLLLGCGPFSCMLATAMACELEHQGNHQVVLLLVDGPAGVPAVQLPHPRAYALYQLILDMVYTSAVQLQKLQQQQQRLLPGGALVWQEEVGYVEQHQQLSYRHQQAIPHLADFAELITALGDQEGAVLQVMMEYQPTPMLAAAAGLDSWEGAVARVLQYSSTVGQWVQQYNPEFVYQGATAMVLADDPTGHAFLESGKESCAGALTLLTLQGGASGEGLGPWDRGLHRTAAMVVEGLLELLAMV
jgi:thioesterase domain-containing protein